MIDETGRGKINWDRFHGNSSVNGRKMKMG